MSAIPTPTSVADLVREYIECRDELEQKQKVLQDVTISLETFEMHGAPSTHLAGITGWVADRKRAVDELTKKLEALDATRATYRQGLHDAIQSAHVDYNELARLKLVHGPVDDDAGGALGDDAAIFDAATQLLYSEVSENHQLRKDPPIGARR